MRCVGVVDVRHNSSLTFELYPTISDSQIHSATRHEERGGHKTFFPGCMGLLRQGWFVCLSARWVSGMLIAYAYGESSPPFGIDRRS
jgi:hypothetical protein